MATMAMNLPVGPRSFAPGLKAATQRRQKAELSAEPTAAAPRGKARGLGIAGLALAGLALAGCVEQYQPPSPAPATTSTTDRLDLNGGSVGPGVDLNDSGQLMVSGYLGTVAGRHQDDGSVQTRYLVTEALRNLDLNGGEVDSGLDLNNRNQFVASGYYGTVVGRVADNGEVSWNFLTNSRGQKLDLHGGEVRAGVALNENGNFIVSGYYGTVVGRLNDAGEAQWNYVKDASGRNLDLSGGQVGPALDLNENDQFVLSGYYGTVIGQISEGGRADYQWLTSPNGRRLDLHGGEVSGGVDLNNKGQYLLSGYYGSIAGEVDGGWTYLADGGRNLDLHGGEVGAGVALNDQGLGVLSGYYGSVSGKFEGDQFSYQWVQNGERRLDIHGGDVDAGVDLNEQNQLVLSGYLGTVTGELEANGEAHVSPLVDRNGRALDLHGGSVEAGVSLNEAGQFVVSGYLGTVHGKLAEDGSVSWDFLAKPAAE